VVNEVELTIGYQWGFQAEDKLENEAKFILNAALESVTALGVNLLQMIVSPELVRPMPYVAETLIRDHANQLTCGSKADSGQLCISA
jgi:hypothetical protein